MKPATLLYQGIFSFLFLVFGTDYSAFAQVPVPLEPPMDTVPAYTADSVLRIKNLNPYITLHVDSSLQYNLEINRDERQYYFYLKNSPVGLKIDKDNGQLSFKAEKSYFLSGKLKYDFEYRVRLGVQNLNQPADRLDTSFSILFYNTEILPSRLKPSIGPLITVEENDTITFKVQCENGSFPIENITFFANTPLRNFTGVSHCDDEFAWSPPFDFVKETDSGRVKKVILYFIGSTRFLMKDTAVIQINVRDALNYPLAYQDYQLISQHINTYLLQLKYTFLQLDKNVKKTKTTRTTFDITSSTTALTGSILSTSPNSNTKRTGQVMPSVGVSLVPIKEAVAPQKVFDQNQASLIRTSIKRLEFMLKENSLVIERDPDIQKKTSRLKDELKQIQFQLIDIPLEIASELSETELNDYFNNPKVNKKYRIRK